MKTNLSAEDMQIINASEKLNGENHYTLKVKGESMVYTVFLPVILLLSNINKLHTTEISLLH